jgi:hypothetical protein
MSGALPEPRYFPQFKSEDVEGTCRIVLHSVVFNYDDGRAGFGDPVLLQYRVSDTFFLDDPRRLYLLPYCNRNGRRGTAP